MVGDELDQFINDILSQKNLPGVTPEVKTQLVADLKERLEDQINRALIEALPSDKMDDFNDLLDTDVDDSRVQQYLLDSGVDVERVTIDTMLRFRSLYLGAQGEAEA